MESIDKAISELKEEVSELKKEVQELKQLLAPIELKQVKEKIRRTPTYHTDPKGEPGIPEPPAEIKPYEEKLERAQAEYNAKHTELLNKRLTDNGFEPFF